MINHPVNRTVKAVITFKHEGVKGAYLLYAKADNNQHLAAQFTKVTGVPYSSYMVKQVVEDLPEEHPSMVGHASGVWIMKDRIVKVL